MKLLARILFRLARLGDLWDRGFTALAMSCLAVEIKHKVRWAR